MTSGTIVWLEDDPEIEWVEERKQGINDLGYSVRVARGLRELDQYLREYASKRPPCPGQKGQVALIILDIMLDGVENLTPYFPWVLDARTAAGYAAGLVFLERILSPEVPSAKDKIFGQFESVPVIIYSNRELSDEEKQRVEHVARRRAGCVKVLTKARMGEISDCIGGLLAGPNAVIDRTVVSSA